MENKYVEVMPKSQYQMLTKDEQCRLMEIWRAEYTNKEIYEAMGYTSHQFYKLIGELGVKAKDNAPTTTKLRTDSIEKPKQNLNVVNTIQSDWNDEVSNENEGTEAQQTAPAINISISDTVNREKAEAIFQSVLAFLSTTDEYNLSITLSK